MSDEAQKDQEKAPEPEMSAAVKAMLAPKPTPPKPVSRDEFEALVARVTKLEEPKAE